MIRCAILLACSLLLGGCLPNTVTIGLGSKDTILRSSAVIVDDDAGRHKVAMIEMQGVIADAPTPTLFGSQPSMIDYLVKRLDEAEDDPDVKAVILRINSPGGTVTGSDIMYREIVRFRERTDKPVVVSMGEIAASGGYYIALAADEIIAEPTTITGSIGVLFGTINVSEGLNRLGIYARTITSGPNKDMGSPLEPPVEAHYAILQAIVDEYYVEFRDLVIANRPGLDPAMIDTLTDGRIVTGADAARSGLVDATGGIRDAFASAKSLAGIENARLIRYHYGRHGPRTPFAHAAPDVPLADADQDVSLLNVDVGLPYGESPVAYYLWVPGIAVR